MTELETKQDGPLNLEIEKVVYGGDGLARPEGRVVLVPFTLPGERVLATPEGRRSNPLRAELDEVLTPHPQRDTPGCPYFTHCGGCHLQHATYALQVEQKKAILQEVIQRVGKFELQVPIETLAGEPWGYRNRIQLHVKDGKVGYLAHRSHRLIDADHCPISSPALNTALKAIRRMAHDRAFPNFVRSIELFTNERDTVLNVLESDRPLAKHFFDWAAKEIPGLATSSLLYDAAGFSFRVSFNSFFQVNRFLIEQLLNVALSDLSGDHVVDLYSGVGLFALPLAKQFKTVTAVEGSSGASYDLEWNAKQAELPITAVRSPVEDFLASLQTAPDCVVADPPRSGLGKRTVAELLRLRPEKIALIACDAATLARDLSALKASYEVQRVTMVDLFPQTYHLETVVRLIRNQ